MISGDVNYYSIDPFNNPYKNKRDATWPFANDEVRMPKDELEKSKIVVSTENNGIIRQEL